MLRLKNINIKPKLVGLFLLIGLIPLGIIGFMSNKFAGEALMESAFDQLVAIQSIKKSQINQYFLERKGDIEVLSAAKDVVNALPVFTAAYIEDGGRIGGPEWKSAVETYGPWLKQYKQIYGYYDLFLIAKDGTVLYTVAGESDQGQNLIRGDLRKSPLAKMFTKALKGHALQDFEPYAPSGGVPAAFVGEPVKRNGRTIGVVALQLPLKAINGIMQERHGMGKTGETYLVGQDKLMRSDSFLDPKNHSVMASFKNPETGSVDTETSNQALAGKSGQKVVIDYNGNPVLSVFAPIKLTEGIHWALLAEIDLAEVREPINQMILSILIAALVIAGIIALVAIFMARGIANPLIDAAACIDKMANGDLTSKAEVKSKDETGRIGTSLNNTLDSLNDLLGQVATSVEQVTSGSRQISDSSQSLSQGANEQAASLEEITSSITELSSQIKQAAQNSEETNTLAGQIKSNANKGNEQMNKMATSMEEISKASENIAKIIKAIDEIAFQTNLLALNAAVEAARAGKYGKGFAVVAEEVRNLASRSASAAKETAEIIDESLKKVQVGSQISKDTLVSFGEITSGIDQSVRLIDEITIAAKEQVKGISQVETALQQIDQVTQQNAANAEESASASEELSSQSVQLSQMLKKFKLADGQGIYNTGNGNGRRTVTAGRKPQEIEPVDREELHPVAGAKKETVTAPGLKAAKVAVKPENVISLEDRDFNKF